MRKILIIIAVCAIALPVFAQTEVSLQEKRAAVRDEIRVMAENTRTQIEQRQAEFREMMSEQRAALKNKVEKKRADLRQRLLDIRDERKRKIVERVDARMDALNERWTGHFSDVLDRLENNIEKIEGRIAQAEARGRDVSAAKSAIIASKAAIAASRTAVASQAGKTYVITVSTEDVLRVDVGRARKALHDDLVLVRDTVQGTRDAVHAAAVALAQAVKTGNEQATTTQATTEATQ